MHRIVIAILVTSLLLSCSKSSKKPIEESLAVAKEERIQNFEWLLAEWIRVDEAVGNITYETWSKENDSTYIGWGYTLAAADTVFEEHMTLHKPSNQWQLEVITPGEGPATIFTMTQHTDSSFVVENPQHDFPTKINYYLKADTLKAVVSNSEMSIDFAFIEINN